MNAELAALAAGANGQQAPSSQAQGQGQEATNVQAAAASATDANAVGIKPDPEDPYNWVQATRSDLVRIIAIDLTQLKQADPRQNIIIHDKDTILVPLPNYGTYYVMGEIMRPGEFTLPVNGHKITIKMALTSAGGFTPMAWPHNAILIRRLEHGQELRKPIRLDRIWEGKDPDILIQPDDVIAVGSHVSAPFLYALRNSFRFTYGGGFYYDRNFSEKNFGQLQGPEDIFTFFR